MCQPGHHSCVKIYQALPLLFRGFKVHNVKIVGAEGESGNEARVSIALLLHYPLILLAQHGVRNHYKTVCTICNASYTCILYTAATGCTEPLCYYQMPPHLGIFCYRRFFNTFLSRRNFKHAIPSNLLEALLTANHASKEQ